MSLASQAPAFRVTLTGTAPSSSADCSGSGPAGATRPLDVRAADPPLGDQPVGRGAAVQHAGGLAVNVAVVLLGDDAELGEVEVGVERLQRIEGPLDQVVALRQRPLALRQLQAAPQAAAVSGSTPSMCDHCMDLPSFMPTIE